MKDQEIKYYINQYQIVFKTIDNVWYTRNLYNEWKRVFWEFDENAIFKEISETEAFIEIL